MTAPPPKRIVIVVVVLASLAVLFLWLQGWRAGPQTVFQGYVEGNFVYVAPESGGRIATLDLTEGGMATAGSRAFALDASLETAQRNEAAAKLNQIRAQLEDLRASQQRPEQVAVLKAQEDQAKAQLDLARADLDRQKTLFQRGYTSKAVLDNAQTAYDRATAVFSEAQRQITAAELAARTATIAAGEAAVNAAEAGLVQAETVLTRRTVAVPRDGRVQDIFFRVGEVVNAGQPVLSLLPPGNMKYRFYVPAPVLSHIRLGQEVRIGCDACPPDLSARISFISKDAEFTPPVIFSDEERAKLVFKVEALPLAAIELPVGLPIKVHTEAAQAAKGRP